MKNTLSEIMSVLEEINRADKEENRTNDIEDGETKDVQSEGQKKK